MAQSRGRTDLYGRPLPALTDAERQGRFDHPHNAAMRAFVRVLLDQYYATLLRRKSFGRLTLELEVHDGLLQEDVDVTLRERFKLPPEEDVMPVLNELAAYLATQGIGTPAVDLFLYGIPQDVPEVITQDAVLALIPVPGLPPLQVQDGFDASIEQPVVQVLVRGTPYGYQAAMVRATSAWIVLGRIANMVLSGVDYLEVNPLQAPWLMRTDELSRPHFVFSVRVSKALS